MPSPTKVCLNCGLQYSGTASRCSRDGEVLFDLEENPFLKTELETAYDQVKLIGVGGSGLVYKARQIEGGDTVAIKVLHRHLVNDEGTLRRFFREIDTMRRVNHPNFRFIIARGLLPSRQAYQVMEYLDGKTLAERLEHGPLSAESGRQIFGQVCDALEAAHQVGLVHRDLKPTNLMLNEDAENPTVKILDLGLAKLGLPYLTEQSLTKTGAAIGSPMYMSPEQCEGKTVDARSDVYSLGCVMYEALTGHHPHAAADIYACMHKQLTEKPLPFSSYLEAMDEPTRQLEQVVFQALEKDPEDRFQSALDLKKALTSTQTSRPFWGKKFARFQLRISKIACLIALLVVGAAMLATSLLMRLGNNTHNDGATIKLGKENDRQYAVAAPYRLDLQRLKQTAQVAVDSLSQRLEKDPNNTDLLLQRGRAYLNLEDGKEAYADYRKVLCAHDLPGHVQAIAHAGKGEALMRIANVPEAVLEFNKALSIRDVSLWRIELGRAYNLVDQPEQASRQCTYVIDKASNMPTGEKVQVYGVRSQAWCQLGKLEDALKDISTAIQLQDKSCVLFLQRAKIYKAIHQNAKALDDVNHALSIDPQFPPALALRDSLSSGRNDQTGGSRN